MNISWKRIGFYIAHCVFIALLCFYIFRFFAARPGRERFLTGNAAELASHLGCSVWRFPVQIDHSKSVSVLINIGCVDNFVGMSQPPIRLRADRNMPELGELVIGVQPQVTGFSDVGKIKGITLITAQLWARGRLFAHSRQFLPGYLKHNMIAFRRESPLIQAIQLVPDSDFESKHANLERFIIRIITDSNLASQMAEAPLLLSDLEQLLPTKLSN